MCPDSETLSAYFDGELDLYWRNKISHHLANCEKCRNLVNRFDNLRTQLPRISADILQISQKQQWLQLQRTADQLSVKHTVLQKRVAIPLPVLAAAMLVLFFFAGFSIVQQRINQRLTISMQEHPENISVELSYQSLQQLKTLAEMFSGKPTADNTTEVFLTIPSHPVFQTNGSPQVIRSIDVSRGN